MSFPSTMTFPTATIRNSILFTQINQAVKEFQNSTLKSNTLSTAMTELNSATTSRTTSAQTLSTTTITNTSTTAAKRDQSTLLTWTLAAMPATNSTTTSTISSTTTTNPSTRKMNTQRTNMTIRMTVSTSSIPVTTFTPPLQTKSVTTTTLTTHGATTNMTTPSMAKTYAATKTTNTSFNTTLSPTTSATASNLTTTTSRKITMQRSTTTTHISPKASTASIAIPLFITTTKRIKTASTPSTLTTAITTPTKASLLIPTISTTKNPTTMINSFSTTVTSPIPTFIITPVTMTTPITIRASLPSAKSTKTTLATQTFTTGTMNPLMTVMPTTTETTTRVSTATTSSAPTATLFPTTNQTLTAQYALTTVSSIGIELQSKDFPLKHESTTITTSLHTVPKQKTTQPPRSTPSLAQVYQAIHVACEPDSWNITVNLMQIRTIYPGIRAKDIYLGSSACNGVLESNVLVFQQSLNSCLTNEKKTNTSLNFRNKLIYAEHDPVFTFIVRRHVWDLSVECDVPRESTFLTHVHHKESHLPDTVITPPPAHTAVSLAFYSDQNFQNQISGSPLQVKVGDTVYAKAYIVTHATDVKLVLKTCYMKPQNDDSRKLNYFIIKNGCVTDPNTSIISILQHEVKFAFQEIEYSSHPEGLDISCQASVCDVEDYSSKCSPTCLPDQLIGR